MSEPRPPSRGTAKVPSAADKITPASRSRLRRVYSHRRRHLPLWVELPLLLLVAFCAAVLLRTFVAQPFEIPSGSMEQTLKVGDRVLVNKLVYQLRDPQRGEVVVFRGTDRWSSEITAPTDEGIISDTGRMLGGLIGLANPNEKDLIKRIIGLPGDTVACCDDNGRVTVNDVPLNESDYVYDNADLSMKPSDHECRPRRFEEVTVPPGTVFVMGDHRGDSEDSRCQGFVPIDSFIGRAVNVVWPKSSWKSLDVPDSFDPVIDADTNAQGPPDRVVDGDLGAVAPMLLTVGLIDRRRGGILTASVPHSILCVHSLSDRGGGTGHAT